MRDNYKKTIRIQGAIAFCSCIFCGSSMANGIEVTSTTGINLSINQDIQSPTVGIYAENNGTSNVDITVNSNITADQVGIFATTAGQVSDINVSVSGDITATTGIHTQNFTSGSTTITNDGVINATSGGIYATNTDGTDLTIKANEINADMGIYAENRGTGTTSITTTGEINAGAVGVLVDHYAQDLSVNINNNVTGIGSALTINNLSSTRGNADISVTGNLTATAGTALQVFHEGSLPASEQDLTDDELSNLPTSKVTVNVQGDIKGNYSGALVTSYSDAEINITGNVTGAHQGIEVINGGGDTALSVSGDVKATQKNSIGLLIEHDSYSGAIDVTVGGRVSGGEAGAYIMSEGSGDINLTIGSGVAADQTGVAVFGFGKQSDINVSVSGDITATTGIYTQNQAGGSTTIINDGTINAKNSGIYAINTGGTDLTIKANEINADMGMGIHAENRGSGDTSITTTGEINAGAIGVLVDHYGQDLSVNINDDVTGINSALTINNLSSTRGDTDISVTGNLTATEGIALQVFHEGSLPTDELDYNPPYLETLHVSQLNIKVDGDVSGKSNAIVTNNFSEGATYIATTGSVISDHTAILLENNFGDATVDISGQVTTRSDNVSIDMSNVLGSSTLVLRNGWGLIGQAVSNESNENTLVLSGSENSALDLNQIGNLTSYSGILGFNNFIKEGTSSWTLTGQQQTGGEFDSAVIKNGDLLLDNATFVMSDGKSLVVEENGSIHTKGVSYIDGGLNNLGTIYLNHENSESDNTFHQLVVNGNYSGDGGRVVFNGTLHTDDSPIDALTIKGDVEDGTTYVSVNNLGGAGDQTIDGILVINVDGTSYGRFVQDGRIIAGRYEYFLDHSKNIGGDNENWYLTSGFYKGKEDGVEKTYRPESGSYIANNMFANTMFTNSLYDRVGDLEYVDLITGEKQVTSMWIRNTGGFSHFKDDSGQLRTKTDRYIVQLGGDIAQWHANNSERYHLGVMAGYAQAKSRTTSNITEYRSRATIDGYSAGLYGTWYQNRQNDEGAYVDSWVLYNWFDNTIQGDDLPSESYNSSGITASLESGYTFSVRDYGEVNGVPNKLWLQLQAQLTWMDVNMSPHQEANGSIIKSEGSGNLQSRLGLRTYVTGYRFGSQQNYIIQPFLEMNWIHNTKDFAISMDDQKSHVAGARNIWDVKFGAESQINRNTHLWWSVSQQFGSSNYYDLKANVGFKYSF